MPTPEKLGAISGLPRTGSTLLANILAQNPRIHTTPTSGLPELLLSSRGAYSGSRECHAQDLEAMDQAFMSYTAGAFKGWASGLTDRPVYLDKSRAYHGFYLWFAKAMPGFKVLITIRDLRGVCSSLEKRYQADRHRHDGMENPMDGKMLNRTSRVITWMQSPMIRIPVQRLQDVVETGQVEHMHVVRAEDLTSKPGPTLKKIYKFLEEEPFEHDLKAIAQYTQENDATYGVYGRHTIKPELAPMSKDWEETIGPALSKQIKADNAWFYDKFYKR